MPVIAMTREMGSRGKDVALGLAEEIGVRIVHHEMVEHDLASRLHARESTVHRYLEGGANVFERWRMDKKELAFYTAREIFQLAEAGNVLIRGWGATQLLRLVSHVVCVRVCAPLELRTRTLMERLDIDSEEIAQREIKKNDDAHARVMRRLFKVDWEDPLHYDLVLNTSRLSIQECIDLIKRLVDQPSFQETMESQVKLASLKRAELIWPSILFGHDRGRETEMLLNPDQQRRLRHQRLRYDERVMTREERDFNL